MYTEEYLDLLRGGYVLHGFYLYQLVFSINLTYRLVNYSVVIVFVLKYVNITTDDNKKRSLKLEIQY